MSQHPPARQPAQALPRTVPDVAAWNAPLARTATGQRASESGGENTRAWGWAMVEILADGSWGEPRMVPAPGTFGTTPRGSATAVPAGSTELRELLASHLTRGALDNETTANTGTTGTAGPHEVATVLAQAVGAPTAEFRSPYLGPLAHVEALQGDLRRAERHASQALCGSRDESGAGREHALLAQGWIALERADFATARRRLASLDDVVHRRDQWLATSHTLLEAKLAITRGQPETATRRLATWERTRPARPTPATDWLWELATVARAEALIASGEPQRAMGLLTPAPKHAAVEALVMAALARRTLGDVRGAQAVLSRAATDLDRAPLGTQIEAWLLEARMAEDQHRLERSRVLIDRALRSATGEHMRRVVMRDWGWLSRTVGHDPVLLRKHGKFLAACPGGVGLPAQPVRPAPPAVDAEEFGPVLTERESQILQLLAQMNSTEEIAAALFVTANTVKTHLKGIFGKFGVNRRVDAVRRGRALGLC
jgi:LuxR family maltose regulon positive regulatory protein